MKKTIKRILAIVISTVMLLTPCAISPLAQASGEAAVQNLIDIGNEQAGSFEELQPNSVICAALGTAKAHFTQEQYQWGCYNTDVKTAIIAAATEQEPAHSGNNYLKATAAELWGSVRMRPIGMLLPVQPNTDYYLTFWAKNSITYDTIYAGILSVDALRVHQVEEKIEIVQSDNWQPYRLHFNSGERTVVGIAFGGYKDNVTGPEQSYCLDDVALYKAADISVAAVSSLFEGVKGGTVEGAGSYFPGEAVTLNAVPQSGFAFSHWVGNDIENETANPLTVYAVDGACYKAVFKPATTNLIFNGNFENEQYGVEDVWQRVGSKALPELVESPDNSEKRVLKAPANTAVGMAINNISLEKGHTYVFSCRYYLENAATPTAQTGGSAEQRNNFERIGFWANNAADFTQRYYPVGEKSGYVWLHNANTEKNGNAVLNCWQTKTVLFTATENSTVSVGIGSVNNTCDVDWYVTDIALYDCANVLNTAVDCNGVELDKPFATLRTGNNTDSANLKESGLRVYNALDNRAFSDGVISEFGVEVGKDGDFNGPEGSLTLNAKGETCNDLELSGLTGGKTVAYRKSENSGNTTMPVLWQQTQQKMVYSAFITNIPKEAYVKNYCVRAYAVLTNGQVVYSSAEQFSVFSVAKRIDCGESNEFEKSAFYELINWSVPANALYAEFAQALDYKGTLFREVVCNESADMKDIKALQMDTSLLKELVDISVKNAEGTVVGAESGIIGDLTAMGRTMFDGKRVCFKQNYKVPITVTCALNEAKEIDNFLISTYAITPPGPTHDEFGYGYRNYELYFSENEEDLYTEENHVIDYDRTLKFVKNEPQRFAAQIFNFAKPVKAKFIGIRFTQLPKDGKLRLDLLGAYSNKAREHASKIKAMGASLLGAADLEVNGLVQNYSFGCDARVEKLLVKDKNAAVFYEKENQTAHTLLTEQIESYRETEVGWLLTLKTPLYLRSISSAIGNLLAVLATGGEIEITNTVINNSFLGAGVNVLPMQLMHNSKNLGYRAEFLEKEREAIRQLSPKVARVWFQNNWFQTAWYSYNFEKEEFKAFLEYMDIFKELGTDIELDFSFVVGSDIQSWFCIEGVTDKVRSAPNNLEAFADSVLKCLQYLKQNGYPVKYITISNEPDHKNYIVNAENNDMNAKMDYYVQTLNHIDAALKNAGLRNEFEIWGPECTSNGMANGWLDGIKARDVEGVIDRYSTHDYKTYYDDYAAKAAEYKAKTNGKICVTEFGTASPSFKLSNIGRLISVANNGLYTALEWCLSNTAFADPFGGIHDEGICLYKNKVIYGKFSNEMEIGGICHEYGPAMRYIQKNSSVLQSSCNNEADLHTAAFEKNGEYTIVVETAPSGNRTLTVDLSQLSLQGKKLKRIYYNIADQEALTTVLPTATEVTVDADGKLCETLTATHGMYLYTTIAD